MAWEWLPIISSLSEIIMGLNKKSRSNNVTKKFLISELGNNLKHYKTAQRNNFDQKQLISIICNSEIIKALRKGFNFSKVKKGEITKIIVKDRRNEKYVGRDCEWLFLNISDKISELKAIYSISPPPDLKKSNMTLQFSNLFYKMKLLAEFINE